MGLGAPWVFLRLRLAEPSPVQAVATAGDAADK